MKNRLKECRQSAGLTQEQVAFELQTSQKMIWKWESGKCDIVLEKAKRLAILYHVSLDYLAGMPANGMPTK